jgi:acyl-CoA thioester hydrolase
MTDDDAGPGPHVHEVKVRFHQCDGAGHTNSVAYMAFLEAAREELLFGAGLLGPSAGAEAIPVTTAKVWVDYLSETSFGDELVIRTRVVRLGEKSIELESEVVRKEDMRTAARSGCVLVRFDYGRGASVAMSANERKALEKYM